MARFGRRQSWRQLWMDILIGQLAGWLIEENFCMGSREKESVGAKEDISKIS